MKKSLLFAATALAMLASCSQNDDLSTSKVVEGQNAAIEFGTYVGRAAQTRATAYVGNITDTELKGDASGFGVFAFYNNGVDYPNSGNSAPASYAASTWKADFMFNEHITWNSTSNLWTYSPLKYWPNEFAAGAVDGQDPAAQGSTAKGKLSFFAYAPYMDTYGTTGIIKVNGSDTYAAANNVAGNPTITYKMASNGQNVDLLWGTCADAESYNIAPSGTQGGTYVWKGTTEADKGRAKVNVNLTKQKTNSTESSAEKVSFLFKHTLAKIGGGSKAATSTNGLMIKIDPDFGDNFADNATEANRQTVVTVKKITIKNNRTETTAGTRDYSKKAQGTLDLATGFWTTEAGEDDFSQTINNSTDDVEGDVLLNEDIEEKAVTGETVANAYWSTYIASNHTGVTKTAKPVYNTDIAPILYFPGETPSLEVEIEYVVRTKDPKLVTGYSEVTQKIKRTVTFSSAVEMNKKYNLMIILGLTSVKFEATVSAWDDADTNNSGSYDSNDDVEINLPLNVQ